MKKLRNCDSTQERRRFVEKQKGVVCEVIGNTLQDEKDIHCENLIGAVPIPLGIAGPIIVKGQCANGRYFIPLATTEGALVASVNRGSKAVSLSGGVRVLAQNVGVTRGPVFETKTLEQANKLTHWFEKSEKKIQKAAQSTSKHIRYLKHKACVVGSYTFVRLHFNTGDAMGMNMATIATDAICHVIQKETGVRCISIAGNFDIDKKPAWLNSIDNRGFKVNAEVIIKKEHLSKVLKTSTQKIFDVWLAKCMLGSAISGSTGFNAHYANIVAAFFTATGQDLAHVVEGSAGVTTIRVEKNGDLCVGVYLPSLLLGIVGGGTKLPAQKEALSILGASSSTELVEVLAGAVLAGEISLLASLAEGTLAISHQKLGR